MSLFVDAEEEQREAGEEQREKVSGWENWGEPSECAPKAFRPIPLNSGKPTALVSILKKLSKL